MKSKVVLPAIFVILTLSLGFVSCDSGSSILPLIFRGADEDLDEIEIVISRAPYSRSVITPSDSDYYLIVKDDETISSGRIWIDESTWTFTSFDVPTYSFTGTFNNMIFVIPEIPDKAAGIVSTNIGGTRWEGTVEEGPASVTMRLIFNINWTFRFEFIPSYGQSAIIGNYKLGQIADHDVILLTYTNDGLTITGSPILIDGDKLTSELGGITEFTRTQ